MIWIFFTLTNLNRLPLAYFLLFFSVYCKFLKSADFNFLKIGFINCAIANVVYILNNFETCDNYSK